MKRYDIVSEHFLPCESTDGEWVKHSDQLAALAAVQGERDKWMEAAKGANDIALDYGGVIKNLIAERDRLAAEVEELKKPMSCKGCMFLGVPDSDIEECYDCIRGPNACDHYEPRATGEKGE